MSGYSFRPLPKTTETDAHPKLLVLKVVNNFTIDRIVYLDVTIASEFYMPEYLIVWLDGGLSRIGRVKRLIGGVGRVRRPSGEIKCF